MVENQLKVYELLKEKINNYDKCIALIGAANSGKTFVINKFSEYCKYNKMEIIKFTGSGKNTEPYSTINLKNNIFSPLFSNVQITLKLKVLSISKKEFKDNFNSDDYKFISKLTRITNDKNKTFVIIADKYDDWDLESKKLFDTVSQKCEILGDNCKFIKVVNDKNIIEKTFHEIILLDKIKSDEIEYIVKKFDPNNTYGPYEFKAIYTISEGLIGNVYDIVTKITNETCSLSKYNSMNDFINDYIKKIEEENKSLYKILSISTLLNQFDLEELNQLSDIEPEQLEEYLNEAVKNHILEYHPPYIFTNSLIFDSLYSRIKSDLKLRKRNYDLYSEKNPQAYYERYQKYPQKEDFTSISLLVVAYIRSKELEQGIVYEIKDIFNNLKSNKHDVNAFFIECKIILDGIDLFFDKNYDEAYEIFKIFNATESILLLAQIEMLTLLCICSSTLNTSLIREYVSKLEDSLNVLCEENEYELYLKIQLCLFSVYADKLNDMENALRIKNSINTKSKNQNTYLENTKTYIRHVLSRKSAIFLPNSGLYLEIKKSVNYFKNEDDFQYYMAVCNYGAALMLNGKFEEARTELEQLIEFLNTSIFSFPSEYKIYNNLILAKLFISMQNGDRSYSSFIDDFTKQKNQYENESLALININLINIYILNENLPKAKKLLENLRNNILSNNTDDYYLYYLQNIDIIIFILEGKWIDAKNIINTMKIPSLLINNNQIFENRKKALINIIKDKNNVYNVLEYNEYFKKIPKCDDTWAFYGNILLFSDIMFLSN